MLIKRSNGKRNSKGGDVLEDLGDIDFLCRTKSEVRVQELFLAAARCDIDSISTIPAGWDLYIEVTSMSGKFNEPSKVAKKLTFYDQKNLILYWDEPTISLDKKEHPLHSIIRRNCIFIIR
jgi:hypothetical protein